MPPVSNEIHGAYYFAFVCLSVCPFVKVFYVCNIFRTLHARVLKFYIWVPNEKTADPYFFPCPACLFRVMPLWKKSELNLVSKISWKVPAPVAQLDAPSDWRPGGRGFNPRRGRQHSFVEIDHEMFSTVILSLPLIQEGQLSVSGERMCTILVNRLED